MSWILMKYRKSPLQLHDLHSTWIYPLEDMLGSACHWHWCLQGARQRNSSISLHKPLGQGFISIFYRQVSPIIIIIIIIISILITIIIIIIIIITKAS